MIVGSTLVSTFTVRPAALAAFVTDDLADQTAGVATSVSATPYDAYGNVIPIFAERILRKEDVVIFGDKIAASFEEGDEDASAGAVQDSADSAPRLNATTSGRRAERTSRKNTTLMRSTRVEAAARLADGTSGDGRRESTRPASGTSISP